MKLSGFISRARTSSFHLWVLNTLMARMIPFNKPHGFEVTALNESEIKTRLPFKRRNFNHIRGLHACAMATLAEFTTGFLLISRLDPAEYRIILKRLEMEYLYQGKMTAVASFQMTNEWLDSQIYHPLKSQDSVDVQCIVSIFDTAGNKLAIGTIYWQVKEWKKVRTKL